MSDTTHSSSIGELGAILKKRTASSGTRAKRTTRIRRTIVGFSAALAATFGLGLTHPGAAHAATSQDIAQLALANIGKTACGTNSLGGTAYGPSCTGNGGLPEFWCADFAKWVWANEGVQELGTLNPAAASFYAYGQVNNTFSTDPEVGDAVVFSNDGSASQIHHVAIVTKVNSDGTIETASGDWNGEEGTQAHFASTSHVVLNSPAYSSAPGWKSSMGMYLFGYVDPVGIDAAPVSSLRSHVGADVNGDGLDDLYWNELNHRLSGFTTNGSALGMKAMATDIGAPAAWMGAGDINGDGKTDVYRYEANGRIYGIFSNGSTVSIKLMASNVGAPPAWARVADINGDGKDDIYWYESNGRISGFFSDGTALGIKLMASNVGGSPAWGGTGDINGDGKDDIYWYESNGRISGFFSDGTALGIKLMASNVGAMPLWAGVGDINGDGKADIYWAEANHRISGFFSNGTALGIKLMASDVGTGLGWAGVGDINGDGKDDIYWYETNHRISGFFSNGTALGIKLMASDVGSLPYWAGNGSFPNSNGNGMAPATS